MTLKQAENLNAILLILFGTWIWWYSYSFPDLPEGYPGPALFPTVLGVAFVLVGLLLFLNQMLGAQKRDDKSQAKKGKAQVLRFSGGLLLLFAFPLIQNYVAFIPTLGITCFLLALLLKVQPGIAILTAGLTASFIYLIFSVLLGVSL